MWVREMARKDVQTIAPGMTVRAAAQRMLERHVGSLVVVDDERRPVGIVTDRDLVTRCIARENDPDQTAVSAVMTEPVRTVDLFSSLDAALEMMVAAEIRRLVLTDCNGAVAGMLALDDVLERLVEEGENIGRLLRLQVHV